MDKRLHVERDARKRFGTSQHLSEHGTERVDAPVLLEESVTAKQLLRILREGQQQYLITFLDDDGEEQEQKISAASPAEARAKVKKLGKEVVDVETLSEELTANCRNCGERNDSKDGKYCKKCQKEVNAGSNDKKAIKEEITKRALIRDPETPVGQPGKMHVNCGCGTKVPMSDKGGKCSKCGQKYDERGYLIQETGD